LGIAGNFHFIPFDRIIEGQLGLCLDPNNSISDISLGLEENQTMERGTKMNVSKIIDAIVELEKYRIKREDMVLLIPCERYVWNTLIKDTVPMKYLTKTKEHDRFCGILTVCSTSIMEMAVVSLVSSHSVKVKSDKVAFIEKCECGHTFDAE
jgi:hypothetical protein